MKVRLLLGAALVLVLALPACGGGGGSGGTPEEQVRATVNHFIGSLVDGDTEEACTLTDNTTACAASMAMAEGFLGEEGFESVVPPNWEEVIDEAEVTFQDEDHATMAPLDAEDEPTKLVRKDGKWVIVVDIEQ